MSSIGTFAMAVLKKYLPEEQYEALKMNPISLMGNL